MQKKQQKATICPYLDSEHGFSPSQKMDKLTGIRMNLTAALL
jgi:hypothetical protein